MISLILALMAQTPVMETDPRYPGQFITIKLSDGGVALRVYDNAPAGGGSSSGGGTVDGGNITVNGRVTSDIGDAGIIQQQNVDILAQLATLNATVLLVKAKTDNLDVLLSTRTKPADSQTVTGTVTASGPLTDTQLRATPVPTSLSSVPLATGASTDATLSQLLDGGVVMRGTQSDNLTTRGIAIDDLGRIRVVLPPAQLTYPPNPLLPLCNPVRRSNCR